MDTKELRTLRLLEVIEAEDVPSQRDLAKRLDVSLGLVNSFIKRLAHKGYFKVKNIPKNRIRYILTPKGAAEKTRLTYLYIQHSLDFYGNARRKLRRLFRKLTEQGVRRICFYGANDLAEIAFISLKETPLQLAGVVDDANREKSFVWGEVLPITELEQLVFDRVLITKLDDGNSGREKLISTGVSENVIINLQ